MLLLPAFHLVPDQLQSAIAQFDGLATSFLVIASTSGFICLTTVMMTRAFLTNWRAVLVSALLMLFGGSIYFYLVVASMGNPPANWGYARTVEGFIHLISRGQYERIYPTDNIQRFVQEIGLYWRCTGHDLGFIFLVPALAPFCFLHKMRAPERSWILALIPLFFCLSLWLIIMQNASTDRASADIASRFYTPSHLIITLWAGYGLCILGTLLAGCTRPKASSATEP